ncbi:MAG TPA: DoxX-like family protein [Phycisphaerales bacterium]|nr:DoxX-like family protein [Phycisphaerales bacterium]
MGDPIYVEITIDAPLDRLWTLTQTPQEHQRWDLRFSRIEYIPRESEDEPQRFTYQTRLGVGMTIAGTGRSVGNREINGERASSLWFASEDRRSLIREGSGYWRYIPTERGVRFLTLYDYRTRFGVLGEYLDDLLFRPLMGWATAWSFDRLRLWLERGIDPGLSAARAVVNAIARVSLALCWAWQGFVPKLLIEHPREQALVEAALPRWVRAHGPSLVVVAGLAEVVLALALLVFWSRRWPYVATLVVLAAVTLPALLSSPGLFVEPFNPASLAAAMVGLALCGLVACRDLPSAGRCLRRKPGEGR